MAKQYTVTNEGKLLPFLFETLSGHEGWAKKTVKQYLQGSSIQVNGKVQTRHDHPLTPGDVVSIGRVKQLKDDSDTRPLKLEILYQDHELIAINKPAGLLSVATAVENKNHALSLLRTQLSRGKEVVKLWPVHRLDRDTSGIMLFATSKETREAVMEKWDETEKVYLAIVEGKPKADEDTSTAPLRLDKDEYRMHVGEHPDAKAATTHYKLRQSADERSLLEVRIETGRQHQIRAHMAWMGNPVVGDERYGKKGVRMGLHAMRLAFRHPGTGETVHLEVDAPRDFYDLLV